MINKSAKVILNTPVRYINQGGKPYTLNSSFIEFALPPLYLVFLLKRNNHTFSNVRAIIKLIKVVAITILKN